MARFRAVLQQTKKSSNFKLNLVVWEKQKFSLFFLYWSLLSNCDIFFWYLMSFCSQTIFIQCLKWTYQSENNYCLNFDCYHLISPALSFNILSKWIVGYKKIEKGYIYALKGPWAHFIHFCSGLMIKVSENFCENLNQYSTIENKKIQALKFLFISFCFTSFTYLSLRAQYYKAFYSCNLQFL